MFGSFIAWLQGKTFSLHHIDAMLSNSTEKDFKPFDGVDFQKSKKGPDVFFKIGLEPWMFAKIEKSDKVSKYNDGIRYGNCFIYKK